MGTSTNKKKEDVGLPVGSSLPSQEIQAFTGELCQLDELDKPSIMIFISMYCSFCIDLLPHLSQIQQEHSDYQLMLFSTGDDDDHRDMIEYFKWNFPVFHMDQSEMENWFDITQMPFIFVTNRNKVICKGVAYDMVGASQLILNV
ncbi:TlpA family protein disulfide reductase [Paenibacillus polymyxa]|uniref:TlpA family protein disulfide reductase n=1 Tax=Paenibacillus polymyxa TaxID=1406 RepID=UPI000471EFFE|nr:redoxin domain-containing protein [Paenibacillus polymyxa]